MNTNQSIVKNKLRVNHLAIIPDGNRRWARARGLSPWLGHREGAKRFEEIARFLMEYNLSYFTFWAASKDNLTKRSKQEIKFLYQILAQSFQRLSKSDEIHKNEVKVEVIGAWPELAPPGLKRVIKNILEKTKNYKRHQLTLLLGYDGVEEMLEGIRKMCKNPPTRITYTSVKKFLPTSSLPPVDYIIRTGVENDPHNSAGFMMWHTIYSQYYFTSTLWPDFHKKELSEALQDFKKRDRRLGG